MEDKIIFNYNNKEYSYTKKELANIIEFYKKMQFTSDTAECPLCGCDLFDNGLFVCSKCGELKVIEDDECTAHNEFGEPICKDCCEMCQDEKWQNDMDNLDFDTYYNDEHFCAK